MPAAREVFILMYLGEAYHVQHHVRLTERRSLDAVRQNIHQYLCLHFML